MRRMTDLVLLAENRLLRDALIRLLEKKNEIRVVGAFAYSTNVHDLVVAARPHVILLDSTGLTFLNSTLLSALQSAIPNLRIVMVDMESDEAIFLRAIRAGAVGYILKDASATDVISTIRAVTAGQAVCPPCLSLAMFRFVSRHLSPASLAAVDPDAGLSRREQQMVELLRERLTNKEIAARLGLSEQTVKNHVHHVLRKLGVQNRMGVATKPDFARPVAASFSAGPSQSAADTGLQTSRIQRVT